MAKMKFSDYKCVNGAYHTDACCDTCWNTHPENEEGLMFVLRDRYEELRKKDWIDEARSVDFTYEQAEFLYAKIVGQ